MAARSPPARSTRGAWPWLGWWRHSSRPPSGSLDDFALPGNRGPVLVRLGDEAGDVRAPLPLDIAVVVQVQLAVDDGERGRISARLVAAGRAERTEAAVLRCVLLGIGRKSIAIGPRHE